MREFTDADGYVWGIELAGPAARDRVRTAVGAIVFRGGFRRPPEGWAAFFARPLDAAAPTAPTPSAPPPEA